MSNSVVRFYTVSYKPSLQKLNKKFRKPVILMIDSAVAEFITLDEFKAQLANISEGLDARTVKFSDDHGIGTLTKVDAADIIDMALDN